MAVWLWARLKPDVFVFPMIYVNKEDLPHETSLSGFLEFTSEFEARRFYKQFYPEHYKEMRLVRDRRRSNNREDKSIE